MWKARFKRCPANSRSGQPANPDPLPKQIKRWTTSNGSSSTEELVLDLKKGAFFANNSTVLTEQAKKDIDSFLSDRGENRMG